ncbi:MAG: tRNA (adenosine(37)-N6)-dimethylallyltransferase MiaA [Candidatus Vogelbacteria bacterium]
MKNFPVIVIVGPTSSGKSALAVRLARQFGGEIISADSRQVYRGLDIGSGKVTRDQTKNSKLKAKGYLHQGIPHHLLDVANPRRTFTVAQYQKLGTRALEQIIKRGKVPIICGGTGFYIDALLGRVAIPSVPPNQALRTKLEKLSTEKLFSKLQTLDKTRAENIDRHNRRRLIRAIEIAITSPKGSTFLPQGRTLTCKTLTCKNIWLTIGIKLKPEKLREKINARLKFRIDHGLIAEVKKLHENGLSWRRLDALGLEYRFVAKLLQREPRRGGVKREEIAGLERNIWHYAKRQMTWWKRDKTIYWIKNYREAEQLTRDFLKK